LLVDRRNFLKSIGIIGGSAALSCNAMAPEEVLSAYLTPPAEMVPGRAAYYATICRACPAGCGILVKTREGRPIKLEGNPAHPVNRGALCARGQAFIQELYGRDRATAPLVRRGGKLTEVSWSEALDAVAARLKKARGVGFLSGLESGSFAALIADFVGAQGPHLMYEPVALASLAAAAELLFGEREVPRIDLSRARHVVSIGADFLF
jgi:molybdopterin-containing oxidoreductase family iron-sulfur binding subunit